MNKPLILVMPGDDLSKLDPPSGAMLITIAPEGCTARQSSALARFVKQQFPGHPVGIIIRGEDKKEQLELIQWAIGQGFEVILDSHSIPSPSRLWQEAQSG